MRFDGPVQVVLDSSVVSVLFRPNDSRFPFYDSRIQGLQRLISFQTVEEVLHGAYRASWGPRRIRDLMAHLNQFEVIWPNHNIVDISANLRAQRALAGRRSKTADSWIAATAIYLGCPLASDDSDFDGIPGLDLIRRA